MLLNTWNSYLCLPYGGSAFCFTPQEPCAEGGDPQQRRAAALGTRLFAPPRCTNPPSAVHIARHIARHFRTDPGFWNGCLYHVHRPLCVGNMVSILHPYLYVATGCNYILVHCRMFDRLSERYGSNHKTAAARRTGRRNIRRLQSAFYSRPCKQGHAAPQRVGIPHKRHHRRAQKRRELGDCCCQALPAAFMLFPQP